MPADVIIITGTPGTGKTTIANLLRKEGFFVINLFDFAKKWKCIDGYDESRDSAIVDTDKLHDILNNYLNAGRGVVIIEGHYADAVPEKYVKKVFVLSAPLSELRHRLEDRGYSAAKIEENLQSEIMQVCWVDSVDVFGTGRVTKIANMTPEEIAELIKSYINVLQKH